VVFLTFLSRHIIERIHHSRSGTLREIQKNIRNGNKS